MALIDLWRDSRTHAEGLLIHQIVMNAGEGVLRDDNEASKQFRLFLKEVPPGRLIGYCLDCLNGEKFEGNGFVLQDIVNEMASRLQFSVTPGRYTGRHNGEDNYDGIWESSDGWKIIVEVKTKDNFKIELSKLDNYRNQIVGDSPGDKNKTSILIVIGGDKTHDLEAQIRGSRYAWDIRVLGISALIRLVELYVKTDSPDLSKRIFEILKPKEFTRVDAIIDLVFSTLTDEISNEKEDEDEENESAPPPQNVEPDSAKRTMSHFHDGCVKRIDKRLGLPLVKERRTNYRTADGKTLVALMVSKLHNRQSQFWFGLRDHAVDSLKKAENAYAGFGCGSESLVFLIPFDRLEPMLPFMYRTENGKNSYFHIHIRERKGKYLLHAGKERKEFDITEYKI